MIIRRLHASFGNLKDRALSLSDGFNIIQAPNESGKSTWCAFIRTMLFGLSSDRAKSGYLPDKARYQPWSGAPMEGTADLITDGRAVTITRSSSGRSLFRNFSAQYTGTAEKADWLTEENAGEQLTGASAEVFVRSAFIGQAALRVSSSAGLEKRIAALVSTGDEQISYSQAMERLKARRNGLKYNKSGTIPALENQLQEASLRLNRLEAAGQALSSLREKQQQLQEEIRRLQRELTGCDRQQRENEQAQLRQAQENAGRLRQQAEALEQPLSAGGKLLTWQQLSSAESCLEIRQMMKQAAEDAGRSVRQARKAEGQARDTYRNHPFCRFDPSSVAADLASAARWQEEAASQRPGKTTGLRLAILLAAALCCAALSFLLYPWGLLPGLAAAACGVYFGLIRKYPSAAARQLNALLAKYQAENPEALQAAGRRYLDAGRRLQEATAAVTAALQSETRATEALRQAEERLTDALAPLGPSGRDGAEAQIHRCSSLLKEYDHVRQVLASAEAEEKALRRKAEESAPLPADFLPPGDSRENLLRRQQQAEDQLARTQEQYHIDVGRLRAMGDPAQIKSEIASLSEALSQQSSQYSAAVHAMSILEEAEKEMRTRFSPLLSEAAGQYMSRLTLGRYDRLAFSRDFEAMAKVRGDAAPHSSLSLSAGTADQLYLALRLAISTLVLGENNRCPLILDDALAFFDDERAKAAMELLYEISRQRQILLFTCHSREADLLQGREGVRVITEEVL